MIFQTDYLLVIRYGCYLFDSKNTFFTTKLSTLFIFYLQMDKKEESIIGF